jgi:UDP:flavonoid glycosyltransferase YjiC (YdhE family)
MLVVPFAHDQYDNGERVVGSALRKFFLTQGISHGTLNTEHILQRLLSNSAYRKAAATLGEQVREENGRANAADAIEAGLKRL